MDAATVSVSIVIPVFRDGARAREAANAMLRQSLPDGASLEIIVVDDGSGDDTAAYFAACKDRRVRFLQLPINRGRSGARNAGAAVAAGSIVLFMDCDCLPADQNVLMGHIAAFESGAVASCGHVTGIGADFWSRYQDEASRRRQKQHASGIEYAGSSQNLAVRRSEFEAIGGFDTGYRRYGFEDRDLLIRLSQRGAIAWTTATVRHQDALCLLQVASKMAEAGQHTSIRFADRHPDAYRTLRYEALDAQFHSYLKPLARLTSPLVMAVSRVFDYLGCVRWMPYVIAKWIVRLTSALAYSGGTARSR